MRTLVVLVCLLAIVARTLGSTVFDVYKLVQLDRGSQQLGSRRSSLDLLATTVVSEGSLSRYIILLEIDKLTVNSFNETLAKKPGGLLFLIPKDPLTGDQLATWLEIQEKLISNVYHIPIYFAHKGEVETSVLNDIIAQDMNRGASTDESRLVVMTSEPKALRNFNMGWLMGASKGSSESGDLAPTIAIVANYDSFAAAPELAIGANSNAGGVAAAMQLAKIFSRLYSVPRSHGKYNLLFLLTTGGRLNYVGSNYWLEHTESRILDSLSMVLCLDTISGGEDNELYLHVSRPPKDNVTKSIYDTFSHVAREMGIEFSVVQKKINISDAEIAWEHEQYSRRKLMAGTLSRATLNISQLSRNVKYIAEVLARLTFDVKMENLSVFEGMLAPDEEYLQSWINVLTQSHRFVPFLTAKHPLISTLERGLSVYLNDVSTQNFKFDGDLVFYNSTGIKMAAYTGKPVTFDLMLGAGVLVYLGALYTVLKGPSATLAQVKAVFSRRRKL